MARRSIRKTLRLALVAALLVMLGGWGPLQPRGAEGDSPVAPEALPEPDQQAAAATSAPARSQPEPPAPL